MQSTVDICSKHMNKCSYKVQSTEIQTPIIRHIAVLCTFAAFIDFSTTNILRLCRFQMAIDSSANGFSS